MKIAVIILPIFLSAFILYVSILSRKLKIENVLKRFSSLSKKFSQNNRSKYYEDLQLLIEHQSSISFFKIKIRSVENILILRIFLSSLFFILLNLFGFLFSSNLLILSLLGSAVIFFIPLVIIKNLLEKTKETVLEELPDTIEITSSLLKAGLTIDEAILYIAKNYPGKISNLFKLYQVRILEGYTKSEAFTVVGKLSFCDEFITFLKVIEQSENIGNPISDSLKNLSNSFRNNQRDKLKIKAEKIESNLMLVIFIFLFLPMVMIFLLPVLPQIKLLF